MKKIGDKETLRQIANEWSNFPIRSLKNIDSFLNKLLSATDGLVIFDFLDSSNWDCFESFSINYHTGILQINWHDFIEQDKEEPRSEARKLSSMIFPASLYGMAIRFDRLERLDVHDITCFVLKGYALTEKEARKIFFEGSQEYLIMKDRPFSRQIIRKIDNHVEVIDCITSAIFTVLILPKRTGIPLWVSEMLLYQYNLQKIEESIDRSIQTLKNNNLEEEVICEKVNTIRRNMESLLKLECCFRNIELPKPYSQARIGDLWGQLKKYHSEDIKQSMSKFIQWANELSHDSGMPIDPLKAQIVAYFAKFYMVSLFQEIKISYSPIFRQ